MIFNLIKSLGVSSSDNIQKRRTIQLMNILAVLAILGLSISAVQNFYLGNHNYGFIILSVGISYLLVIYSNAQRRFKLAKILLVVLFSCIPWLALVFHLFIPKEIYLGFIPGYIASGVVMAAILDRAVERRLFWASTIYLFLTCIFFDLGFYYLSPSSGSDMLFIKENYFNLKVPHLLALAFVITAVSLIKDILTKYESLHQSLIEELHLKNGELKRFNADLECRVRERTEELAERNQRLADIAFINSHKLRGPLSSIMGVTNYLRIAPDDPDVLKILPELFAKAEQMDNVIRDMNYRLTQERDKTPPDIIKDKEVDFQNSPPHSEGSK